MDIVTRSGISLSAQAGFYVSVVGYSILSTSLPLHMSSFPLSPGQGGDSVKVLLVSFTQSLTAGQKR